MNDVVSAFQRAFIDTIANLSGISPLRVSNTIMLEQVDADVMMIFALGERSGVIQQTLIRDMHNETSVHDAKQMCNESMIKADQSIIVHDESKTMTFVLGKQPVGMIPFSWIPPPKPADVINNYGYGGGSMFILAMFMLVIGAGIGVGVAFYLWKRQRTTGGLTYQVFE